MHKAADNFSSRKNTGRADFPSCPRHFSTIFSLRKIYTYLTLCRVSNLPTVWTNVLTALVLAGEPFSLGVLFLLCLSLSLFYAGGMCLNDFFDAEQDRRLKPFRPLPAGKISRRNAALFAAALLGLGLALLFLAPSIGAVLPGLLLLVAVYAYNFFHQRYRAAILIMALCRFLVFIIAAMAATGETSGFVLFAGGVQFFYVLLISSAALLEKQRGSRGSFPLIPVMIAGISLLDGLLMTAFASPAWLPAGIAGSILTMAGQKFIRGD